MTYHPDSNNDSSEKVLRVGWLDRDRHFSKGTADPEFLEKLKIHYEHRVRQTRGFHVCPFCEDRRFGRSVDMNGKTLMLGSAEIEIKDDRGRVFVAPDLLYHYIVAHDYLPPREFVNAVCQ
jgi:hypothetical protein